MLIPRHRDVDSRFAYHLRNAVRSLIPRRVWQARLEPLLAGLEDPRADAWIERALYYNKVADPFQLSADAQAITLRHLRKKSNYVLDLLEYQRYFPAGLRVDYRFGDRPIVHPVPKLMKSRPVDGDNANTVLFKLNKARLFRYVEDHRTWKQKASRVVWRGHVGRPNRKAFLTRYHDHPLCDAGEPEGPRATTPWQRPYLTIDEQLAYKFVVSLEGNDIATNLCWIFSSNSLCVMPRPKNESWFMEGRLEPGVHYVGLADDASDLEERVRYYLDHPDEAQAIVRNAHAHLEHFRDPVEEPLVALLVLYKYFAQSGQIEPRPELDERLRAGRRAAAYMP